MYLRALGLVQAPGNAVANVQASGLLAGSKVAQSLRPCSCTCSLKYNICATGPSYSA
jgi:hypothetical protein